MAYPNLPGITVNLNDLGLQIAPPPAGPKVTFLGITSNTGVPLREPFSVSNVGAAVAALWISGSSGEKYPGELALAVEEAAKAGANNIEVVVIAHKEGATAETYALPTGAGPSARYYDLETAYDAIIDKQLDVVVPVNAWADCPAVSGKFTSQLAKFCYKATTQVDNACIGVIPVMPPVHWALAYRNASAANTVGLTGNANIGTEVTSIDSVTDLVFGSPSQALITEWEKYLTRVNSSVNLSPAATTNAWSGYLAGSDDTTYGFLNYVSAANAATAVNSLYYTHFQGVDLTDTPVVDQRGNKADAGSRISVFGAPLVTSLVSTPQVATALGASVGSTVQNTDGSATYAGLITSLLPHSAPTNKKVTSVAPLRKLSSSQANRLAGRRIVTMLDRSVGFVVANAITGGKFVSTFVRTDFTRLTTVRIVDAAVETIRNIGERFIGEPNTAAARNAMSAEIDKALRAMKASRAITGYRFFITATPDQQVLGEATVDLTLTPAFELLQINVNVSLTKQ
jgi:hypothetical protein